MLHPRKTVLVALMMGVAGTTACDRDRSEMATADPGTLESPGEISPEMLAELQSRYPTLRAESAPEPQPNGGADPTAVPDRVREAMPDRALQVVSGEATFYADKFEGRRTASGIPFRQNQLVAAHRGFPFGTLLRVTNTSNNRSVNVRVVDRGPFGGSARAQRTIIDLSRRAAQQLGYIDAGRAQVRVEVLEWGEGLPRA